MTHGFRLRHIRIEGFRSLEKVELEPGPVTVLIGPNGCGKSNFLMIFRLISAIRNESLQRFIAESGGGSSLLRYGPKFTRKMTFEVEFEADETRMSYCVTLKYAAADGLFIDPEILAFKREASHELRGGGPESILRFIPEDAPLGEIEASGRRRTLELIVEIPEPGPHRPTQGHDISMALDRQLIGVKVMMREPA